MPSFVKQFGAHKIEVRTHMTGNEEVLLDDSLVSKRFNWFNPNSYHDFEIVDSGRLSKGYAQIRTYYLDMVVGLKIVIDGNIIERAFWRIPSQMTFRQMLVWAVPMFVLGYLAVEFNRRFQICPKQYVRLLVSAEFLIVLWVSYTLSSKLSNIWARGSIRKLEDEMNRVDR